MFTVHPILYKNYLKQFKENEYSTEKLRKKVDMVDIKHRMKLAKDKTSRIKNQAEALHELEDFFPKWCESTKKI